MPVVFIGAQLMISWYGYFTGKLSTAGQYFGIAYDSFILRTILVQLEYIWVLVLINILFSMGFHLGFGGFKNFLVIALIWIASGPIAALIFNTFVAKEKLNVPILVGLVLIVAGAVLVVANKEVQQLIAG